jgi:SNF2 family DNA or RNA helicase
MMQGYVVFEILQIDRSASKSPFSNKPLDSLELKSLFPKMEKPFREDLLWLNKQGIAFIKEEIKKGYTKHQAGISFEDYFHQAILRKLHERFQRLKPFMHTVPIYHKMPVDNVRYTTGPCVISTFSPALDFSVTGNRSALHLELNVKINGSLYPIGEFKRTEFFLESNNEYFILSYKDFQTLSWVERTNISQYSNNPEEFLKKVINKIEEDYSFNRNNLFPREHIKVSPGNRILMNEISNNFLMITPQWNYDGIIIEGSWEKDYETTRNGTEYVVERNKKAEEEFKELLESLHPNFRKQLNGYYYLSFADAQKGQWFSKAYHKLLSLDIEITGMDMLNHFRYSQHLIDTAIQYKGQEGDHVEINAKVRFGSEEIPLPELQKIILSGQRALLLKDGSLGLIPEDWLSKYATLFRFGKFNKNQIRIPRWIAFSTEDDDLLKPVIKEEWRKKWNHWRQQDSSIYPPDPSMKAVLRPYQQKGFEWMMLLSEAGAGACLADDMGLGKTLQTICVLNEMLVRFKNCKHLIVCPSSLLFNWLEEFLKFAPHIRCHIFHGVARQSALLSDDSYQVYITSYGTVRSDAATLASISFRCLVLDESHYIKNPSAQITGAVCQLDAKMRIALSGTPVMNNTFDLYAQLNFLLPGFFGSREFFKREYADPIDRDRDEEKIKSLQKLTMPFILRRTKEQVAPDLPSKTEMIMWCEMSASQKEMYENIRENVSSSLFLNIKKEGVNKNKLAVLQGIMKLRQVCNSPLLLPETEQTSIDSIKTSVLMDELVNNLGKHKALVFSQFTGMLSLLATACDSHGISYYKFDGQTPPQKRAELVNKFQDPNDTTNIFLISLKAGNAGLNLTAADYVFLFDPWWNTAVQQQAIDRTHRIGQTKNVFAYKMVCKDTIEEKIIQLQNRKKQLAENLIPDEDGFVQSLSADDIAFLFS